MADGSLRVERTVAPIRAQVSAKLRQAILERRFMPGQRLLERELCELTGASRTSVREALRQLEAEGLVSMVPNKGPIVAWISEREMAEIYQVRAVLEGLAGRLFAVEATDEQTTKLRQTVEMVGQAVQDARLDDLLALKDLFYTVLLNGAGNGVVQRTLRGLHTRIQVLRATTLSQPGRPQAMLTELQAIAKAIEARDPDEAARACTTHVERAAAVALSVPHETPANEWKARESSSV